MQIARWTAKAPFILVGDGGFACAELAWNCLKYNGHLISRLKINASLFGFPPPDVPGKRGRKRTKGEPLPGFREMLNMQDLKWIEATIQGYGKKEKQVKYISSTAMWGADGFLPVPIRWVLVIDPTGELDPLPLMSTDVLMSPEQIIELYIRRWNQEVTFEEVREHLGVETQRQWSDNAITRTTPILMGLYTLVCLIAGRMNEEHQIEVAQTAWYEKRDATFRDLLKCVRKELWKDNLNSRKCTPEAFRENSDRVDEPMEARESINEPISCSTDVQAPWKIGWVEQLLEYLIAA